MREYGRHAEERNISTRRYRKEKRKLNENLFYTNRLELKEGIEQNKLK
jgi:hypothetical protein